MIKKYAVLLCVVTSITLLVIATFLYPGGSIHNNNSTGFDWTKNFFSNLFAPKAINGADNPARLWALIGIAIHSLGYGLFFISTSRKIPNRHAAKVLFYTGVVNMFFTFLIATPLHDVMVTLSSTLTMLGLFYITVFVFKTKLHLLKVSCVLCMMVFYYTLFLYGMGNWGLLAIMQKVCFIGSTLLVLGIEYFTKADDFKPVTRTKQPVVATNQ